MKLKKADPRKWYSELKKITRIDQHEAEEISVEDNGVHTFAGWNFNEQ